MLSSLSISNYALISKIHIDFSSGMSVITGETGAGKSIILGALSLIQGQRADLRVIRKSEEKAIVEAVFSIKPYSLQSFFEENELDYEDECIVRRELLVSGKSRAFINDTPVSLSVLRELSVLLFDIHSQHENLLLVKEDYQLQVLDAVAQNEKELLSYQEAFKQWNKAKAELKKLKDDAEKQTSNLDFIQFQFQQLDEARLIPDEQEELESEQEVLSHVEEIKTALQEVEYRFSNDEMNLTNLSKESIDTIARITSYFPKSNEWLERLKSIYIELKDLSNEISASQADLDFNPERMEFINNRLDLLYGLQNKFRVKTVEELIELRNEFDDQLNDIENFDFRIEEAEKRVNQAFDNLQKKADSLLKSRTKAKPIIEKHLITQLKQLGMPDVQVEVQISEKEIYEESGKENISFLFSANKNHPVQAVAEIASGGEISRFMLAIKSLLVKKSALPTLIFDEVDTGVSGEIAAQMGDIMQEMSSSSQIMVITHLPQIAAKGEAHYRVFKKSTSEMAETFIEKLDTKSRIDELSIMLGGRKDSEAAILNAKELLGVK